MKRALAILPSIAFALLIGACKPAPPSPAPPKEDEVKALNEASEMLSQQRHADKPPTAEKQKP